MLSSVNTDVHRCKQKTLSVYVVYIQAGDILYFLSSNKSNENIKIYSAMVHLSALPSLSVPKDISSYRKYIFFETDHETRLNNLTNTAACQSYKQTYLKLH